MYLWEIYFIVIYELLVYVNFYNVFKSGVIAVMLLSGCNKMRKGQSNLLVLY